MTTRTKLAWGAAAAAAAFLLGFVPQYRAARALEADLRAAQDKVRTLESEAELARLRDLAGQMFLESVAMNYGVAREHSARLFALAEEIAVKTSDPRLRDMLNGILKERDRITAGLAEGKGAAQADIERLMRLVHGAAQ
jgi:hypothetical protein